jgi:uncharacterized membrane protein YeaQ/YmgE (transglycosylase-associated protein family)
VSRFSERYAKTPAGCTIRGALIFRGRISIMGILSWLIVGLVAGFIGSKIVNRSGEGLVRDIILGILGAVVGDAIFTWLGFVGVTGVNVASIVVAAIGAILILIVYHAIFGKRATA